MTREESIAINSLRFTCIIFLVLLHTHVDHLVSQNIVESINSIQTLLNAPFLNMLFILSGYLFFYSRQSLSKNEKWLKCVWGTKIKKRCKTLLLPYLIWCVVALAYNHFMKDTLWPHGGKQWLMQFWDIGTGHPIGKAMWYIKSLIVFTVLSPLYYYSVKWLKHLVLIIILMLFTLKIPIDFPWFNVWLLLGAYIAITRLTLKDIIDRVDWRLCLILWIALKILLYIDILPFNPSIPMVFFCFIGMLGLFMRYDIPYALTSVSSFIYFTHPYFTGVRTIYIKMIDKSSLPLSFFVWMLTAVTVIVVCYCIFRLMKSFTPKILSIITGDRI